MRVTKCGKNKSPEQKAINAVVAENGHQEIPKDSIKDKTSPKFIKPMHERIHSFTHCLTGKKETISDSQILEYAKEYISWAEKEELPLKSSFWRSKGIRLENLDLYFDTIPGLKEIVKSGNEVCGERREKLLVKYWPHIAARQPVYVTEYKEHDKEMIAVRERVKHEMEKEDGLTPQQQQALFMSFMEPYLNKKNDAGK